MAVLRKSETSLRQMVRNPSGRVTVFLIVVAIAILIGFFALSQGGEIKDNFDSRPQLKVSTPGPPPHRWTEDQALDFFREYAIARPAPEDRALLPGVETCWDYVTSGSSGDPVPFRMGTNANPTDASLTISLPIWGIAIDDASWRFWENTQSVVGPC